ncbi:hypothetical protein HOU02_gp403 [Caulobacter phage CcrBL9]|uniref:Uncharacterized protein n=1 Tax=Caulobacter phage CcrBL9 TaxID=2283270 RepID=A0A385EEN9_9CAUD|nr:hypothetical protein HOU02_gp403 [Caulobacter phage CcrBL9]AXQ69322.1 hypothetical protein CcrBL9_gp298 [Caulobacter phage CcrBL9]
MTKTYFTRDGQVYKLQLGEEIPMPLGGAKLRHTQHLTDAGFNKAAYPEVAEKELAQAAELAEAIREVDPTFDGKAGFC